MAWMTRKAPTKRPTKSPAGGAGWLGGRPGLSAGLSEQDGCGGEVQEGEQSSCERIRSGTPEFVAYAATQTTCGAVVRH